MSGEGTSSAGQPPVDQTEYWNGEVGERWARNQARLDRVFQPLTDALLAHAAPQMGEQAIDVGCGCGALSLALARRLGPAGSVLALDVSRPMLAIARSLPPDASQDAAPIEWREADASAPLVPAPAASLLASRLGVMFFADPAAAFAQMRRALRPGGRVSMLCWRPLDQNPWITVARGAALEVVPAPEPPPPHAPGPFAFADAERVGRILTDAGYESVNARPLDAVLPVAEAVDGSDEAAVEQAVAFTLEIGPASALLRDAGPATRQAAFAAARRAMRDHAADGRVALGAACWLYSAVNPGGPGPT